MSKSGLSLVPSPGDLAKETSVGYCRRWDKAGFTVRAFPRDGHITIDKQQIDLTPDDAFTLSAMISIAAWWLVDQGDAR